ncbi:hypothetical protein [Methanocorpusculum sp. GPch4]|uniref:hypothetical protein n=1 Tax=Methanocorpusculum sp. GPch4 TaxID=2527877 RepID=UPI001ADE82EC|nr:hypothetical protein [Methanocorpusculum sp. GPch4]
MDLYLFWNLQFSVTQFADFSDSFQLQTNQRKYPKLPQPKKSLTVNRLPYNLHFVKKQRILHCEIKRHRQIAPELCAVCPRVRRCKAFRIWYQNHHQKYLEFVLDIVNKFPEKYQLEVEFMAEKQQFVQIVDMTSGKIERIVNLKEIDAMSAEDKLALSREKNLFIVTHRLQPIVRVEMKKSVIESPMQFSAEPEAEEHEFVVEEPVAEPPKSKGKGRRKKE